MSKYIMGLTICAEYFVIDWNFSYIEVIVCIWTTVRLPDCSINFHIWKNWLFSWYSGDSYRKIIHNPCQRVQYMYFLLQCSPFSDLHELQKNSLLFINRKTCTIMYFMHLLTECVCLWSYIHFTLYLVHMINIFRVFCHITHMFYRLINIIISYKSDLRFIKNWILPKNIFLFFSYSLLILVLCLFQSNTWN